MIKKISNFFVILLLIFCLSSCDNKKDNDEKDNLNELVDKLEINEGNYNISDDIYVDSYVIGKENKYKVEWTSSNTNYLKFVQYKNVDIVKGQLIYPSEETKVTVTATINNSYVSASKIFNLVVLPSNSKVQESIKESLDSLDIKENDSIVSEDFQLINYIVIDDTRIDIDWNSSNDSITIEDNETSDYVLATINRRNENIVVELTISVSYEGITKTTKIFVVVEATNENYGYLPELNLYVYEDDIYNTKYEVSLYIITFKKLPKNYYKKDVFYDMKKDWSKDNLISCGGDVFQNREGLLPKNDSYQECDIEYTGGGRNEKRVVFSIKTLSAYYTGDHYSSFEEVFVNGVFVA